MQTRDKDGHALCPMCGGQARLLLFGRTDRKTEWRSLAARPVCTSCGLAHPVKTTVACPFNPVEWDKRSPVVREALLAPAWLGWDSAWWLKAREPVVDMASINDAARDRDTIECLKSLGLVKAEKLFNAVNFNTQHNCEGQNSGGWWRVDDEGTIHESKEVALEAVWEGCEGHAPDHVGLTEYRFDPKQGALVRTGDVLVVDFTAWLKARGVTDEPEVQAP